MSSEASKPTSVPNAPEGYKTFLVNRAKQREFAKEHLYRVLTDGLICEPDGNEQIGFRNAAEIALWALEKSGVDLVFDEHGNFKYVVT